ncbi:MAG: DMT family transporter [Methanolobus sp.]
MLSGLSYSGTIMTVSYLKDDYTGFTQLFWSTLLSLIILAPFGSKFLEVLRMNLGTLVLFGLVTTAFASVLYLNSAAKIRAQTVSVVALLEPVSGIILGFFFLQEPIFMNTINGCVFIILGSLILLTEGNPRINFGRNYNLKIQGVGKRATKLSVFSYLRLFNRQL